MEPAQAEAVRPGDPRYLLGKPVDIMSVRLHARAGIKGQLEATPARVYPVPGNPCDWLPASESADRPVRVDLALRSALGADKPELGPAYAREERALAAASEADRSAAPHRAAARVRLRAAVEVENRWR